MPSTSSLLGSGVINVLTPLAANAGIGALTTSRVLLGAFQGGIMPALFATLCKWLPSGEKAIGFGMTEVGTNLGSITASGLGGYLAEYGFAGGWVISSKFSSDALANWHTCIAQT